MSRPIYCRSTGQLINACKCFRCIPVPPKS